MLVCGDSGVGKTLFGFEVLKEVGGVGCGIYVSCGVSRSTFLSRYDDLSRYLCDVISMQTTSLYLRRRMFMSLF